MEDTDWRPSPCPRCGQIMEAHRNPVCDNPRCKDNGVSPTKMILDELDKIYVVGAIGQGNGKIGYRMCKVFANSKYEAIGMATELMAEAEPHISFSEFSAMKIFPKH